MEGYGEDGFKQSEATIYSGYYLNACMLDFKKRLFLDKKKLLVHIDAIVTLCFRRYPRLRNLPRNGYNYRSELTFGKTHEERRSVLCDDFFIY